MLRVKQLARLLRSLRILPPSLVIALASLDAVAQNMAIKGATILDVTNGEMIKNHVVIVKDGRIDSVAPARSRSEERRVGKECRSRCSPYH